MIQFQHLLLSSANRALCPRLAQPVVDEFTSPMTHYWAACSHNSYLERDQILSNSSAEMYSRLLLQGCRSVEIDCWDGDDSEPVVTHGNTLCSKVGVG